MVYNLFLLRPYVLTWVKNTVLFLLLAIFSCGSSANEKQLKVKSQNPTALNVVVSLKEIKTGAENFDAYFPLLKDKKIGIVTNQTGILPDKMHLVDFLMGKKINITKIFAPEHGFRGMLEN